MNVACCWKYCVVGESVEGLNMVVWACSMDSKKSVKLVGATAGAFVDDPEGPAVNEEEVVAGGGADVVAAASEDEGKSLVEREMRAGNPRFGAPPSAIRLLSLYSSRFWAKLGS